MLTNVFKQKLCFTQSCTKFPTYLVWKHGYFSTNNKDSPNDDTPIQDQPETKKPHKSMLRRLLFKDNEPPKNSSSETTILLPSSEVSFPTLSYLTKINQNHFKLLQKIDPLYVGTFLLKKFAEKDLQSNNVSQVESENVVETEEILENSQKDETFAFNERRNRRKLRQNKNKSIEKLIDTSKLQDAHLNIVYDSNTKLKYDDDPDSPDSNLSIRKADTATDIYLTGVLSKIELKDIPATKECFGILKGVCRIKILAEKVKLDDYPAEIKKMKENKKKELKSLLNNQNLSSNDPMQVTFNDNFVEEKAEKIILTQESAEATAAISNDANIEYEKIAQEMVDLGIQIVRYEILNDAKENNEQDQKSFTSVMQALIQSYNNFRVNTNSNIPELWMVDQKLIIDFVAGFLASTKYFKLENMQKLLENLNTKERLTTVYSYFKLYQSHFLKEWNELQKTVNLPAETSNKANEYEEVYKFLKQIQEKSSSPSKKMFIEKIKKNVMLKVFPQIVLKQINEELDRLMEMPENHPDYNSLRNSLELITCLPYGIKSQDNFDLVKAKKILDDDHYGIEDVKERILEFIAVAELKGSMKGRTILLIGPPGCGKTTVASSIAKCLNRKFERIALGGEHDVAIVKGHRKTYIGAYPGRMVNALKKTGTENPVILLDEIDKLGKSYRGNIADALLEILDPAQNSSFIDNYLEVPIDLSNVLFICSANLMETINQTLLDRMEVIHMSGYTAPEKKAILHKYLLPKAIESSGIKQYFEEMKEKIVLSEDVIKKLLFNYTREAGVRNLERKVKRICEKISLKIVQKKEFSLNIEEKQLIELLGLPDYSSKKLYDKILDPGVSIGLAYNSFGGSVLYIETIQLNYGNNNQSSKDVLNSINIESLPTSDKIKENKNEVNKKVGILKVTGMLGDVMQESIQIAYSYAKFVCSNFLNNDVLERNDIHIHFPAGASKKDGPSAGITITTALISQALNIPIADEIAMTGEISLTGKVLKIGGVKEKVLAAKREGITKIVLPIANQQDIQDLKEYIKEGIEFKYAENYFDVMKVVFPSLLSNINSNTNN